MKVSTSFAFLLLPVVFVAANAEENSIRKRDVATIGSDTKPAHVLKGGDSSAFFRGKEDRALKNKGDSGACGACISDCASKNPPKVGPQNCNSKCACECRGKGNEDYYENC